MVEIKYCHQKKVLLNAEMFKCFMINSFRVGGERKYLNLKKIYKQNTKITLKISN